MEVKINREIRNYTEAVFFGLSLRQIIFSACALAVAVAAVADAVIRRPKQLLPIHFRIVRDAGEDLLHMLIDPFTARGIAPVRTEVQIAEIPV